MRVVPFFPSHPRDDLEFNVPFCEQGIEWKLIGSKMVHTEQTPLSLFLHGGGIQASKERFDLLRSTLFVEYGIASCAFDFIGHGATGGDLLGTSLYSRTCQASAVINCQMRPSLDMIVASSMGAYTALKLLEMYSIDTLVLFVPAVYSKKAYRVPFGFGFSDIIREKNSWMNSDAWEILGRYRGKLLIISAEEDEVIPKGCVSQIYEYSMHARTRTWIELTKCSHRIMRHMDVNGNVLKSVSEVIHRIHKG